MPEALEFAREELCASVAEAPIGIRVGDDRDNDVSLFDTTGLQFLNELCIRRGLLCFGSLSAGDTNEDNILGAIDTKSGVLNDEVRFGVFLINLVEIHPIVDRRCVVRALTPSPSLLCGTRRRRVRLAEIGKIRAHQPHIGRHPIAEGRVRDQRENHVHHVVAEAAAVEGGKAERGGRVQFIRQDRWAEAREELRSVGGWVGR